MIDNTAKLYIEIIVWLTPVFVHEDVPCMMMVVKMAIMIKTASTALCLKTDP